MKRFAAFLLVLALTVPCAFAVDVNAMSKEEMAAMLTQYIDRYGELEQPEGEILELEITPATEVEDTAEETAAEEAPKAEYEELKKGSDAALVMQLQERLIAIGYLSGKADGDYGSDTRRAVRAFQQDNGLEATGVADAVTLEKIYDGEVPAPAEASAENDGTLQKGDTGEAVLKLQERLMELNWFEGPADGEFRSTTKRAVRHFQRANGMEETGIADAETLEKIYAEQAETAVEETATEEAAPEEAKDDVLEKGDKGEAVLKLQQRLAELNWFDDKADGEFHSSTKTAVRHFQRENGLEETGIADAATQERLFSEEAVPNIEYHSLKYEDASRDPEGMKGKYVTFKGKVLQVIEVEDIVGFRIASKNDYDDVLYVEMQIPEDWYRIIEGDKVTVKGQYAGLLSYESAGAGTITIPQVKASEVTLRKKS